MAAEKKDYPDRERLQEEFDQQVKDFGSGLRAELPWPLNEPLPVDPKRWGEASNDGNVHRLPTPEQRRYRDNVDKQMEYRLRLLCEVLGFDIHPPGFVVPWKEMVQRLVPGLRITTTPPQGPKENRGAKSKFPAFETCETAEEAMGSLPLVVVAGIEDAMKRLKARGVEDPSLSAAIENMDPQFRDELRKPNGKPLSVKHLIKQYGVGKRILAEVAAWRPPE